MLLFIFNGKEMYCIWSILQQRSTQILLGMGKQTTGLKHTTSNVPSHHVTTPSIPAGGLTRENSSLSDDARLSFVREDVVRKDELRRDLPDHSEHRVVLLVFVSKLLPQLLLELNLIKALVILGCVYLS